jgi:hypothetical protein
MGSARRIFRQRAVRQHEGRWLRMTETFDGMTRLESMLGPVDRDRAHRPRLAVRQVR